MTQDQITQHRITQHKTLGTSLSWSSVFGGLARKGLFWETRTGNVVRFTFGWVACWNHACNCFATSELGQESCQPITCKLGYVRRNASSGSIAAETTCCEESCHLFACPPRYTHKSTSLMIVGKISACCEKSCALFICEGTRKISFSSKIPGTSSNCCESTTITTTHQHSCRLTTKRICSLTWSIEKGIKGQNWQQVFAIQFEGLRFEVTFFKHKIESHSYSYIHLRYLFYMYLYLDIFVSWQIFSQIWPIDLHHVSRFQFTLMHAPTKSLPKARWPEGWDPVYQLHISGVESSSISWRRGSGGGGTGPCSGDALALPITEERWLSCKQPSSM